MKVIFNYAEICVYIGGDDCAIWLGPFNNRIDDAAVFEVARAMGFNPVQDCAPHWKQRQKRVH